MQVNPNDRGFPTLYHQSYPPDRMGADSRLAQCSSIVGNYPDALRRPGTSALWIGREHHLNREEVAELIQHLQSWLDTGDLAIKS